MKYSWKQAETIVFLPHAVEERGPAPARNLILEAVGGFAGQMLRNAFTLWSEVLESHVKVFRQIETFLHILHLLCIVEIKLSEMHDQLMPSFPW